MSGGRVRALRRISPAIVTLAFIGAAVLAIGPALAILPKVSGDSVLARAGDLRSFEDRHRRRDGAARSAARQPVLRRGRRRRRGLSTTTCFISARPMLALLTGISGWEADAAMTWFAAFASLTLMMGLAAWIAGRAGRCLWVLPFAARRVAAGRFSRSWSHRVAARTSSSQRAALAPGSVHASWAPQHLISASCVVLAIWLMSQLAQRGTPLLVVTLALVAAAGFESSTWVGGVTFAGRRPGGGTGPARDGRSGPAPAVLARVASRWRRLLAACLAAPFILDQVIATAARDGGAPIALQPTAVLGEFLPEGWRRAARPSGLLADLSAGRVSGDLSARRDRPGDPARLAPSRR